MLWCNDLWYFDVDQNFWAQINVDSKPKARDSHSALVLGNTILILGGWVLLMCNLCLFVQIGQKKLQNALFSLENKDKGTLWKEATQFFAQLEESHFAEDMWQFDTSILNSSNKN